ncbi:MAG: tRNA lysidine(34) synthetase TilS [Candidatus Saccharimonadales bacterium]
MKTVKLPAGRYIVAVSGGVDSMALLDMLRRQPDLELIAVHVNHGMRPDSGEDEKLVDTYSMSHNIKLVKAHLHLEANTSEATSRTARYSFLRLCRKKYNAKAIVTAHHQDDLIETAIINILRGTGWRGLAPFVDSADILRPLVEHTKNELTAYAKRHNVPWREDPTNVNQAYLRNYVRHRLVPRAEKNDREFKTKFLQLIRKQQILRRTITDEMELWHKRHVVTEKNRALISRYQLIMLPRPLAYELLQELLRKHCGNTLQRPLVERVLLFAKVARPGKVMPIGSTWQFRVDARTLIVEPSSA